MKPTNRRVFVIQIAAAGSSLAALQATAQTATTRPQSAASQPQGTASRPQAAAAGAASAAPKVDEKDPQAMAMAYVQDTTKADKKKHPKHSAEQKCNNCQLYAGKPTDASALCPLFPGKHVVANAWCSAYVKKA